MKKFFLVAALCLSMAAVASAEGSKAVVSFGGYYSNLSTAPASTATAFTARMYDKCPLTGLDMVWGGSAFIPGGTSRELAFSILTGVEFKAPVLGNVELVAQSGKAGETGSPISLFHTVSLSKNFLYNLTDKVQLGLTVDLLTFSINDSNSYVGVMHAVKPVVAMNVSLF